MSRLFGTVFRFDSDRRAVLLLMAAYLAAELAVFLAVTPEQRMLASADNWQAPAIALVEHGGFVRLDDPSQPDLFRPPLVALLIASVLKFTGDTQFAALVPIQILLLGLAGLFVRDAINAWWPRRGWIGLALFWFNPVLFFVPQVVQSESLFILFIAYGTWSLVRYGRDDLAWPYPLHCGIALALACLSRPTPMFLLFAMPVAFALVALVAGRRDRIARAVTQGVVATGLAVIIMAPWLAFMAAHGHGYSLSDRNSFYRHTWDQVITIYAQAKDITHYDATRELEGSNGVIAQYIARRGSEWTALTEQDRKRELTRFALRFMVTLPPSEVLKGLARSAFYFHFGGGAGEYRNLFGLRGQSTATLWGTTKQGDALAFARTYIERHSGWQMLVSLVCLGFAAMARLLGMIGIYAMARRGEWALLIVLLALIGYFTATILFLGTSRYRVPAEPALTILAVYGISFLAGAFEARRRNPS